jgi:putative ABC transport system permease protein
LSTVSQDVTFALRRFRRRPGFAIAAIVTLALGIRATTAIFTLVDGILLRPLPFPDRDRLVAINTLGFPPGVLATNPAAGEPIGTSYPNYFDWQRENHTFESIAAYHENTRLFAKANNEGAQVIPCGRVSANLFLTLGVAPSLLLWDER